MNPSLHGSLRVSPHDHRSRTGRGCGHGAARSGDATRLGTTPRLRMHRRSPADLMLNGCRERGRRLLDDLGERRELSPQAAVPSQLRLA